MTGGPAGRCAQLGRHAALAELATCPGPLHNRRRHACSKWLTMRDPELSAPSDQAAIQNVMHTAASRLRRRPKVQLQHAVRLLVRPPRLPQQPLSRLAAVSAARRCGRGQAKSLRQLALLVGHGCGAGRVGVAKHRQAVPQMVGSRLGVAGQVPGVRQGIMGASKQKVVRVQVLLPQAQALPQLTNGLQRRRRRRPTTTPLAGTSRRRLLAAAVLLPLQQRRRRSVRLGCRLQIGKLLLPLLLAQARAAGAARASAGRERVSMQQALGHSRGRQHSALAARAALAAAPQACRRSICKLSIGRVGAAGRAGAAAAEEVVLLLQHGLALRCGHLSHLEVLNGSGDGGWHG